MNVKLSLSFSKYCNILIYIGGLMLVFVVYVGREYIYERDPLHLMPKHLRKYVKYNDTRDTQLDVEQLSARLRALNEEREIFPYKKYDPVSPHTRIVVVVAGRDVARLQLLVASLAQARLVHAALLVFSHSHYDDNINDVIRTINFCKTMQIWYPYSLQLHPGRFPGADGVKGRDARLAQRKHHWWWTANFVFDRFEWTYHRGLVVFLQEENYVLPDFFYMLQYAERALSYFPDVEVISLGGLYTCEADLDLLEVDTWRPPFHNGLAFNKTVWRKVHAEAVHYCMYEELSWSYSLANVFRRFPRGRVDMVSCLFPRVASPAAGRQSAAAVVARLARLGGRLFPGAVRAAALHGPARAGGGRVRSAPRPPPANNRGWADVRDHMLCLDSAAFTNQHPEMDPEPTQPLRD